MSSQYFAHSNGLGLKLLDHHAVLNRELQGERFTPPGAYRDSFKPLLGSVESARLPTSRPVEWRFEAKHRGPNALAVEEA